MKDKILATTLMVTNLLASVGTTRACSDRLTCAQDVKTEVGEYRQACGASEMSPATFGDWLVLAKDSWAAARKVIQDLSSQDLNQLTSFKNAVEACQKKHGKGDSKEILGVYTTFILDLQAARHSCVRLSSKTLEKDSLSPPSSPSSGVSTAEIGAQEGQKPLTVMLSEALNSVSSSESSPVASDSSSQVVAATSSAATATSSAIASALSLAMSAAPASIEAQPAEMSAAVSQSTSPVVEASPAITSALSLAVSTAPASIAAQPAEMSAAVSQSTSQIVEASSAIVSAQADVSSNTTVPTLMDTANNTETTGSTGTVNKGVAEELKKKKTSKTTSSTEQATTKGASKGKKKNASKVVSKEVMAGQNNTTMFGELFQKVEQAKVWALSTYSTVSDGLPQKVEQAKALTLSTYASAYTWATTSLVPVGIFLAGNTFLMVEKIVQQRPMGETWDRHATRLFMIAFHGVAEALLLARIALGLSPQK